MSNKSASDWQSVLKQIESTLQTYLVDKAPALPKEWKEIIANITPWFLLISVILTVPSILAIFGMNMFALPFSYMTSMRYGTTFTLIWIFPLIILVMNIMAIPALFKKKVAGWNLLFYAALVGVVQNIITFSLGGLLIGSLIGLYLLFQIKEQYS